MKRVAPITLILLAGTPLIHACGPSKEDCSQLCEWADQVCTDNESCEQDCREASKSDVAYAVDNCLDRTVSSCQSANCCLRFTYTEYYFQQHCL